MPDTYTKEQIENAKAQATFCVANGHLVPNKCGSILLSALDAAIRAQGWISADERLPETPFGCLVIVECDDYHGDPCHEMLSYFVGYDGKTWNDAEGNEVHFEVTHWMPLPPPPAICHKEVVG